MVNKPQVSKSLKSLFSKKSTGRKIRSLAVAESSRATNFSISSNKLTLSLQINAVVKFLLFLAFFTYIIKLDKEGCECSNGWEKEYIKYYSLAVLIICLIEFFFHKEYLNFYVIHSLMGIGGLIFIFSAAKYIHDLKKRQCDCSKSWKRAVLDVYAWLCIIILILSFIVLVFAIHKTKK